MDLATVSPKYQVVIPKRVRDQFGLCPGQQLQVMALRVFFAWGEHLPTGG
ncbi:AbrB/MazE/SpoVT family DNA-binding domain-containing protein [Synechococcus sp. CCY 0621]|nr:AbrB/MazE/SpoVT family DNA-binding domain-containing protein [Synechococcus sp. CCY 0621]